MEPGVWPGLWMVRRRRSPTAITSSSGIDEVVGGEHRGVVRRDPHVDPGVAHRLDRLDVVPVPVGGEHPPHAGGPADLEQELVLVGGVDDDGLTGALAAHHEDVVLERTDDELLDAHGRGLVVRGARHAPRLPGALPGDAGPGSAAVRSGSVRGASTLSTPGAPTVNFAFSDEQEQLRDAVRRFLEAKSPSTEVRRLMETTEGYDPAVWSQMANELGLQSLHIPEEYGGQGFTFVELGIVLEEMGRVLLAAPYFSTVVLAADAIMNAGTPDQQGKLLPGIASGETIAALAFTEPNGKWDAAGIEMVAKGSGDSFTLDGTKMFVIDGHTANLIVVAARLEGTSGEDGIAFFTVDADAAGLTRTPLATMDQTRKQAKLEFSGVAATPLGEPGAGWPALSKTLDQAAAMSANEMVGGAQKVLDMSVEYAKVRVQFGRPIGSFQAIKHKCADMLLEVESGKSAAYYAAWAAAEDNEELPVAASLAKAYCSDAYFHAAAENIQIHGGIGFTWEHDAHLYFKRAKSSEILLGDATYHRELLAQRIGI